MEIDNIKALRQRGLTWKMIANDLKRSESSVIRFVRIHDPDLLKKKSDRDRSRKLTPEEIKERVKIIKKMRKWRYKWHEIETHLKLTRHAVHQFVKMYCPDVIKER